jgi:hypothetical protein
MKIDVYCPECNKLEVLEFEASEEDHLPSNIPAPKTKSSGLTTLSVVHENHTLILEVDQNGSVRSDKIIKRIGKNIEKLLSLTAYQLLELILHSKSKLIHIFIFTEDHQIRKLINALIGQILINLNEESDVTLDLNSKRILFKANSFTFYVGSWSKSMIDTQRSRDVFAFHVNSQNLKKIYPIIIEQLENYPNKNYAILFDPDITNDEVWKLLLKDLFTINPYVFITDVKGSINIVTSLSTLIDKYYND